MGEGRRGEGVGEGGGGRGGERPSCKGAGWSTTARTLSKQLADCSPHNGSLLYDGQAHAVATVRRFYLIEIHP